MPSRDRASHFPDDRRSVRAGAGQAAPERVADLGGTPANGQGIESVADLCEPLAKTLELLGRRLDVLLLEAPSARERQDLLHLRAATTGTLRTLHEVGTSVDQMAVAGQDVGRMLRWVAAAFAQRTGRAVEVCPDHELSSLPVGTANVLAPVTSDALDAVARCGRGSTLHLALRVHGNRVVLEVREDGISRPATGAEIDDVSSDPGIARMATVLRRHGGRVVVRSGARQALRLRAELPVMPAPSDPP